MDAALIDGDHNWYTVYHELGALTKVARDKGAPLPVMILHDVPWPYGRRDLYDGPDTIPKEFRHPHAQRGMSPHKKKLLQGGGLNSGLDNAVEEGGERNGVMTGLEDWMAEDRRAAAPGGAPHLLRAGHRGQPGRARSPTRRWASCSTAWRAPKAASTCWSCPRTSASRAPSSSRTSSGCASVSWQPRRAALPEAPGWRPARRALPGRRRR